MTDMATMVQTEVNIDGTTFLLAQDQDVDDLKRGIKSAIADSGGDFVSFVVVGNREVSVLITKRSRIVISVGTVLLDSRDTGDVEFPYGGFYDLV